MTIRINEEKVFHLIEEKKPKRVIFSAPGGLLKQTKDLIDKVKQRYNLECFYIGDTCYGICDTADLDAQSLDADIAFNIGHSAAITHAWTRTYFIDAIDDIDFEPVLLKAASLLERYKVLGLATFSQHMHQLAKAKEILERLGFKVLLGTGNDLLLPSQVFGCDFSTVFSLRNSVDAFFFLGESEFHAVGVALATGKPTFMLDPYLEEIIDMEQAAKERIKRAVLSVYKAADANIFGVITGLKEGQLMIRRTEWISKKLQMHGKKVFQIAMREIAPERLAPYTDIEAFIQTACPRISLDGYNFGKPVLSIPQADALIRLLEGREINNFLVRPKWIELTVGLINK